MKYLKISVIIFYALLLSGCNTGSGDTQVEDSQSEIIEENITNFKLPDTNQQICFDASGAIITCSGSGQDAAYVTNATSYTKNSDGTVLDNVTGLMWQQSADTNGDGVIDISDKKGAYAAESYCEALTLGGYDDWRLPDIKTMYSLIDFSGKDVSGYEGSDTSALSPFIDTDAFAFGYGDTDANERIIDAQWATTTHYVSTTMNGDATMFGVNLADGRIKGYPLEMLDSEKLFYLQCVRENNFYGENAFLNNQDDTLSDQATGLMWQKNDSGETLEWEDAIDYCEADITAGYTDWKLPDAKELQSIVDYTKSPDTTNSASIDTDYFNTTEIINEAGESDHGFYWSSTTHNNFNDVGNSAVYISFGRALGYMNGEWLDVHGAGAQRSDPKSSDIALNPQYETVNAHSGTAIVHGPQGDVVRIENFARCVRYNSN